MARGRGTTAAVLLAAIAGAAALQFDVDLSRTKVRNIRLLLLLLV